MPAERILLVRHGSYERETWGLDDEGERQSTKAGQECLGMVGPDAIVLSSPRLRAMQTAGIIAEQLGMSRELVLASPRIGYYGESEEGVQSLDETIDRALEEAHFTQTDPFSLIVVTHQPLIDLARRSVHSISDKPFEHTKNGQVFEYQAGSWKNPDYADYKEIVGNEKIQDELDRMAQPEPGRGTSD